MLAMAADSATLIDAMFISDTYARSRPTQLDITLHVWRLKSERKISDIGCGKLPSCRSRIFAITPTSV